MLWKEILGSFSKIVHVNSLLSKMYEDNHCLCFSVYTLHFPKHHLKGGIFAYCSLCYSKRDWFNVLLMVIYKVIMRIILTFLDNLSLQYFKHMVQ